MGADTDDAKRFYALLPHYGVPRRIAVALPEHFELPAAYSGDAWPEELPTRRAPWLYLHGPTGCGKSTYASYLLALYLRGRARLGAPFMVYERLDPDSDLHDPEYKPPGKVQYVRVGELLHRLKADFGGNGRDGATLFQQCLDANFLVLDDLTSAPSAWELSQLDLLIDKRYGDGSFTVITSNHPIRQLAGGIGSERIAGRVDEVSRKKSMRRGRR